MMIRFAYLASVLAAVIPACATDEVEPPPANVPSSLAPGADETIPPAPETAMARVEVHADAAEVLFAQPDGALIESVATVDGVARATVPARSVAAAQLASGHLIVGGRPVSVAEYAVASPIGLWDDDVVRLGAAPRGDRPDVNVRLPAMPDGVSSIHAQWCGRGSSGVATEIAMRRSECGARKGALFTAGTPAAYAMQIDDLDAIADASGTVDLRSASWVSLVGAAAQIAPVVDGEIVLVSGGTILDGEPIAFDSMKRAESPLTSITVMPGNAATLIASRGRVDGKIGTLDTIAWRPANGSPLLVFDFSVGTSELVDVPVQLGADGRSFAFATDIDSVRDSMKIRVQATDANAWNTFDVWLRADAQGMTLPATDDAKISSIETTQIAVHENLVWKRQVTTSK